ncbi:helix-turn-helix domain-containing protein [Paenibacillus sp. Marseille-Q4541]|uniref:helix-turn-helix domain-containing protein n=1 Tax=Paenibacillus sp. Marseille-Q4541 TaxID=2831522 RepID=UPI001BAB50A6|nr:helix-turn-helix domain-containing protein [Paenibacillus sp. Marseille-Q4541]
MSQSINKPSLGLLHREQGEQFFTLERYQPCEELRPFVKHYWIVEWNLPSGETFSQNVIPNPCVNLIIDQGRTFFFGPSARKYSHQLTEQGCVFGIKFKPAGFYSWYNKPISELADTPLRAESLLPQTNEELEILFLDRQVSHNELVQRMDRILLPLLPRVDESALEVERITTYIQVHHEITKVDEVCAYFQINKRKLQRLFQQYVGLSPKTVIRLYRLQNAAELLDQGNSIHLLQLSMDLGYHDQSHFIKDFKSVIGTTPEAYARSEQKRTTPS